MGKARALLKILCIFSMCITVGNSVQAGQVCDLYNLAVATGSFNVSQNMQNAQQVPNLLNQESQSVLQAIGLKQPNAQQLVTEFNVEGNCGTQMVPLVQDQYNVYISANNSALSYYGLSVTGNVNVTNAYGSNQSYSPDQGMLADFTSVGLLSLGQSIANIIQTVQSAIIAQQSVP
jgi:hypothetical protein